jgi:hypothetical protein
MRVPDSRSRLDFRADSTIQGLPLHVVDATLNLCRYSDSLSIRNLRQPIPLTEQLFPGYEQNMTIILEIGRTLDGSKDRVSLCVTFKPSDSSGLATFAQRSIRSERNLHESESTWEFDLVFGRGNIHRTSACVHGRGQTRTTKDMGLSESRREIRQEGKSNLYAWSAEDSIFFKTKRSRCDLLASSGCGSRPLADWLAG